MKKYLGIDIGGTAVKLGIVDEKGNILFKREESVSFDNYKTPIIDTVIKASKEILKESGGDVLGVGVSATGQIDVNKGVVAGTCGNLPGYDKTPIKKKIEEALLLKCTVANDANCMCLGELWIGAAKGETDVIGITIGTGIGGGIITGGKLLEGFRGLGGEIGHFQTHAINGEKCTCGLNGCFEHYAATTALVRKAETVNPTWKTGKEIFDAGIKGDKEALKLIDGWVDEIAAGLVGLVHIFNPGLILVGGGVSSQEELLIQPLREKIKSGVMPAFSENLEVQAAMLKNDAGLIGAVYKFIETQR